MKHSPLFYGGVLVTVLSLVGRAGDVYAKTQDPLHQDEHEPIPLLQSSTSSTAAFVVAYEVPNTIGAGSFELKDVPEGIRQWLGVSAPLWPGSRTASRCCSEANRLIR